MFTICLQLVYTDVIILLYNIYKLKRARKEGKKYDNLHTHRTQWRNPLDHL